MRISYRAHGGNQAYWQARWDALPADTGALRLDRYPGRHAEAAVGRVEGRILEAGCGAGRVLQHYHRQGRSIVGMDFVVSPLNKLRAADASLRLLGADIARLPFADGSFAAVLAFGLYHNLEHGLEAALAETRRVLAPGGLLCASLRADNLQNRVLDWLNGRGSPPGARSFHKANFAVQDIRRLVGGAGFEIERIEPVENMPFLYKFRPFRQAGHKRFDESRGRAEGYRLSPLGSALQRTLVRRWPASFCNVYVVTARAA